MRPFCPSINPAQVAIGPSASKMPVMRNGRRHRVYPRSSRASRSSIDQAHPVATDPSASNMQEPVHQPHHAVYSITIRAEDGASIQLRHAIFLSLFVRLGADGKPIMKTKRSEGHLTAAKICRSSSMTCPVVWKPEREAGNPRPGNLIGHVKTDGTASFRLGLSVEVADGTFSVGFGGEPSQRDRTDGRDRRS